MPKVPDEYKQGKKEGKKGGKKEDKKEDKKKADVPCLYAVLGLYRYLSTIHASALTALRARSTKDLAIRIQGVTAILVRTVEELAAWRDKNSDSEYPVVAFSEVGIEDGCNGRCREPTPFCCNGMCCSEPCDPCSDTA